MGRYPLRLPSERADCGLSGGRGVQKIRGHPSRRSVDAGVCAPGLEIMTEAPGAEQTVEPKAAAPLTGARRRGLLTGMRVRKKVLVLHTVFWLGLAAVLLV